MGLRILAVRLQDARLLTIGASIITNTIVGVPYYSYSIVGPLTLLFLLRPLLLRFPAPADVWARQEVSSLLLLRRVLQLTPA